MRRRGSIPRVKRSIEGMPATLSGFYRPGDPHYPGPKSEEVQGEGPCWAQGPEGPGSTGSTGSWPDWKALTQNQEDWLP